MSEYNVVVYEQKLAFACFMASASLKAKAHGLIRYGLGAFFPDVLTEWGAACEVLGYGISSKIAWTGKSMTKSDTVPDDTRVPPQVDVNPAVLHLMHDRAQTLGLTLAGGRVFADPETGWRDAAQTWAGACKLYLDILDIVDEMEMYRIMVNDLDGTAGMSRSPAQVLPFQRCPLPLTGAKWVRNGNIDGLAGFFGLNPDLPYHAQLLTAPPDYTETRQTVTSADKVDNDGVAEYAFSLPGADVLAGLFAVPLAAGYIYTCDYTGATGGTLAGGAYASAPTAVEVDCLGFTAV